MGAGVCECPQLVIGFLIRVGAPISIMSNATSMPASFTELVPKGTEVEESGHGGPVALGSLAGKPVVLVLRVEEVLEQESLHIAVWGSADGVDWGRQALFWFPQEFYVGATPAALNLGQRPDIKFLQVRWELNRWGRGTPRPHFKFAVEIQQAAA